MEPSKLTKEKIRKYFAENNIGKELELEFINLIIYCEFARYAPSSNKNMEMKICSALALQKIQLTSSKT